MLLVSPKSLESKEFFFLSSHIVFFPAAQGLRGDEEHRSWRDENHNFERRLEDSSKGSVINVQKTGTSGDLLVEVTSGLDVANLKPKFDEIRQCAGRGLIITGSAPSGSGYDFFSRFFSPKLGVDEDAVCGSVHCALAPYWSKKLGKHNLIAYMASPRGGRLDLTLDENAERVYIRGEAVTVMEGSLLA
ncbi:hypothetical protein J5N97_015100 [Dioscorea zingiberensis]|uniref:Isomerase n=1 Tax=Dioscorea zingiberensis TaxID=325984 RepID=A0A9D5CTM4_9LILI|nr:hypothetical protein J5N97_015100 [Dioscorea zingiberensis]